MNDTIIKTVAEAERDRLIGIIVDLQRKLRVAEEFRAEVLRRTTRMLQQINLDRQATECDSSNREPSQADAASQNSHEPRWEAGKPAGQE